MIWWFLIAALPMDLVGDPLPQYLTPIDVMKQLKLAEPALQACGVAEERTQGVAFQVYGDGTVQSVVWQAEEHVVPDCWTAALVGHRFNPHDGLPIHVSTTVYVRDGQLMLSPQPEVAPRNVGPLMVFVLPENTEVVYEYLHGGSKAVER